MFNIRQSYCNLLTYLLVVCVPVPFAVFAKGVFCNVFWLADEGVVATKDIDDACVFWVPLTWAFPAVSYYRFSSFICLVTEKYSRFLSMRSWTQHHIWGQPAGTADTHADTHFSAQEWCFPTNTLWVVTIWAFQKPSRPVRSRTPR